FLESGVCGAEESRIRLGGCRTVRRHYVYIMAGRSRTLHVGMSNNLTIFVLACMAALTLAACRGRVIEPNEVLARASGIGSAPAMPLRDGTVCMTEVRDSLRCGSPATLPGKVVEKLQRDDSAFYGIFDANGDGEPRLFLDYWPKSGDPDCPKEYRDESHDAEVPCGAVALQVYQRTGDTFREEMKLGAPTAGYSPAAWFIRESPLNKALFMTRCQGSGGNCLYYLDFKKRVLETVSEDC